MTTTMKLLGLTLVVASVQTTLGGGLRTNSDKPHVVFILADDYGFANLGYQPHANTSEIHTPNLNDLATSGMILDRHYSYKICSPSRSSIQSGRLPVHVNVLNTAPEVHNPDDLQSGFAGIPRNMTGLAAKMKLGGYKTHLTGKWDVGMATWDHTPMGRGYDTWLGYFHHANDYWTFGLPLQSTGEVNICLNQFTDLYQTDGPAKELRKESKKSGHAIYEEEIFTNHTLDTIRSHNPQDPLFLFHSFHIVHTPLQVPENDLARFQFIDHPQRRKYAAMTFYMDRAVGDIVGALKEKKMWDNTLLIFMSDNGGPIYNPAGANNYPLKGGKYSDWEGGVRTNAFVSGGFVPEAVRGTKSEEYIHISDWYSTLSHLAEVDEHDMRALAAGLPEVDGVNQWDMLTGQLINGRKIRQEIHLSEQALIQGDMKLVVGVQRMTGWTGPSYPNNTGVEPSFLEHSKNNWDYDCGSGCLYNIKEDPTEHVNLADELPDVKEKLIARLEELNRGNFNPVRGKPSFQACIQAVKNGGFYGPFVGMTEHNLNHHHDAGVWNEEIAMVS